MIGIALLVAAVIAPGAIGTSSATSAWTQVSPSSSPSARYNAAMATDANGNVVLFGGNGATLALSDTWLWNGAGWNQTAPAMAPSGRAAAAVATDKNGKVVLFGGINSATAEFKNDTWLWDGTSWAQASPSTSPPARYGASMATDKNGNVVLFGGQGPTANLNDTWLWDGSGWTQASPSTSPSARVSAGMATDRNGIVVLFGGFDGRVGGLNDTWLWDGSNWDKMSLVTTPPSRTGPAMAADGHGAVVLFGGAGNVFYDDTWLWDGSSWTQASPGTSPSARVGQGMAREASGKIVLFGGYQAGAGPANDTWLFSLSDGTDLTKPTVTISRPVDGAVYPLGKVVSAAFKCVDKESVDLIKIGFGLNGDRGLAVLSSVASVPVACPAWATHTVPAAGTAATAGLAYGVASAHYSYGWQTSAGWAGTCRQFQLQLNDGTQAHTAVFMFFA